MTPEAVWIQFRRFSLTMFLYSACPMFSAQMDRFFSVLLDPGRRDHFSFPHLHVLEPSLFFFPFGPVEPGEGRYLAHLEPEDGPGRCDTLFLGKTAFSPPFSFGYRSANIVRFLLCFASIGMTLLVR